MRKVLILTLILISLVLTSCGDQKALSGKAIELNLPEGVNTIGGLIYGGFIADEDLDFDRVLEIPNLEYAVMGFGNNWLEGNRYSYDENVVIKPFIIERLRLLKNKGVKNVVWVQWPYNSWQTFSFANMAGDDAKSTEIRNDLFDHLITPIMKQINGYNENTNEYLEHNIHGIVPYEELLNLATNHGYALDVHDTLSGECQDLSNYDWEDYHSYVSELYNITLDGKVLMCREVKNKFDTPGYKESIVNYLQSINYPDTENILSEFDNLYSECVKVNAQYRRLTCTGQCRESYDEHYFLKGCREYLTFTKFPINPYFDYNVYGDELKSKCEEFKNCQQITKNSPPLNEEEICYREVLMKYEEQKLYKNCLATCHAEVALQEPEFASVYNYADGLMYKGSLYTLPGWIKPELASAGISYRIKSLFGDFDFSYSHKLWIENCNLKNKENSFEEYTGGCKFKDNNIDICKSNHYDDKSITDWFGRYTYGQDEDDAPVWMVNDWIINGINKDFHVKFAEEAKHRYDVQSYAWVDPRTVDIYDWANKAPTLGIIIDPYFTPRSLRQLSMLKKLIPEKEILFLETHNGYGNDSIDDLRLMAATAAAYGPDAFGFYGMARWLGTDYGVQHKKDKFGEIIESKQIFEDGWIQEVYNLYNLVGTIPKNEHQRSKVLVIANDLTDGGNDAHGYRNEFTNINLFTDYDWIPIQEAKHVDFNDYDLILFHSGHQGAPSGDGGSNRKGGTISGKTTKINYWPITHPIVGEDPTHELYNQNSPVLTKFHNFYGAETTVSYDYFATGDPIIWNENYLDNQLPNNQATWGYLDQQKIEQFIKNGGLTVFVGTWDFGLDYPSFTKNYFSNVYQCYSSGAHCFEETFNQDYNGLFNFKFREEFAEEYNLDINNEYYLFADQQRIAPVPNGNEDKIKFLGCVTDETGKCKDNLLPQNTFDFRSGALIEQGQGALLYLPSFVQFPSCRDYPLPDVKDTNYNEIHQLKEMCKKESANELRRYYHDLIYGVASKYVNDETLRSFLPEGFENTAYIHKKINGFNGGEKLEVYLQANDPSLDEEDPKSATVRYNLNRPTQHNPLLDIKDSAKSSTNENELLSGSNTFGGSVGVAAAIVKTDTNIADEKLQITGDDPSCTPLFCGTDSCGIIVNECGDQLRCDGCSLGYECKENVCVKGVVVVNTICGDNIIDADEQCDNGEKNTDVPCLVGYGSSCDYCDLDCKLYAIEGEKCGDGTIQTNYEECDGTNLNGLNCENFNLKGDLKCNNNCELDFSKCLNPEVVDAQLLGVTGKIEDTLKNNNLNADQKRIEIAKLLNAYFFK